MDTEVKNQFDAIASFRDHAWKEFQEKSSVEWRLSLAIWATFLSAAAVALATERFSPPNWVICASVLVLVVVGCLHLWFLHWVQRRLRDARAVLTKSEAMMSELIGLALEKEPRGSAWKQPTIYLQIAVTVLVGCIFVATLMYKSANNAMHTDGNSAALHSRQ